MIDFHDVRVVCRCAFAYIHLCIVSRRVHSHRQDAATLLSDLAPAKGAAGSAPEPALATAAAGSATAPEQEVTRDELFSPSPPTAPGSFFGERRESDAAAREAQAPTPGSGRPLHTVSSTHTVTLNLLGT